MAKIGEHLLLFWLGLLAVGWGQAAQAGIVTGELDKADGTLEDQFTYTLGVQGSLEGEPEFPAVEGLEVQKAGTSQSVSIINGKFSREMQYQFVLVPSKEGTFPIPPIRLKVDGEWQQTLPLEIRVKAGSQAPAGASAEQPIFVERIFSREKIFAGESILARLRIFQKVKIYGASPEFKYPDSFQARNLDEQKSYTQVIDGEPYTVTELLTVLTPQTPGNFSIEPAVLQAKIAGNRRRSRSLLDDWMSPGEFIQKRFRTAAAQIEVLALPVDGRRLDFTGLIGEFNVDAAVSQRSLKVGETTTLNLTVRGKGATTGMADPELKLGDRAKVYKDKPQSLDRIDAETGVVGERVLKYAIVPTRSGELDLGELKLQVFNSQSAQYEDISLALGTLQVEGGEERSTPQQGAAEQDTQVAPEQEAKEVKRLGEDLVEPHEAARLKQQQTISARDWTVGTMGSLASLGLLTAAMWTRQRERSADVRQARRRRSQAWKRLQNQLQQAEAMLAQGEGQKALRLAQQEWKRYCSDKFDVNAQSLTWAELERSLTSSIRDEEMLKKMRSLWAGYDKLLFGGSAPTATEVQGILAASRSIMLEVDKSC